MYKKDDLFYKIDLLPSQRTSINLNIKYKFREGVRRRGGGGGNFGDMFAINSFFFFLKNLLWSTNPVCVTSLVGQIPSAYLSVPKATLALQSSMRHYPCWVTICVPQHSKGYLGSSIYSHSPCQATICVPQCSKGYLVPPISSHSLLGKGNHLRTLAFQRLPCSTNLQSQSSGQGQPSAYLSVPKVTLFHQSSVTVSWARATICISYCSIILPWSTNPVCVTALAGQPLEDRCVPKIVPSTSINI